ncbi:hypothetical protein EDC01DRAFT_787847 [Geopyxis carbonaria]|nr:hypothetical protein EDC01DRAFT_787847 [Geopyxis carbonaria]
MLLATILCTAGLAAAGATGSVQNYRRATTDDSFQLYAYGTNISGLSIFYGDGLAYIGNMSPPTLDIATNVTFMPSPKNETIWAATPVNSSVAAKEWTFYIDPPTGNIGFVNSTGGAPDGAITTGFGFYGHNAIHVDANGGVNTLFWAAPMAGVEGTWRLLWNVSDDGNIPVAVKDMAPIVLD